MKKSICIIFTIFTLSEIVKGAWWVAAAQPIILSFGATLAAFNIDVQPLIDFDWSKLLIFKKDKVIKGSGEVIEAKGGIKKKVKPILTDPDLGDDLYSANKDFQDYLDS